MGVKANGGGVLGERGTLNPHLGPGLLVPPGSSNIKFTQEALVPVYHLPSCLVLRSVSKKSGPNFES